MKFTFKAFLQTFAFALLLPVFGWAQSVSGTVYDSDKKPLPGVTIVVKGTTVGASTNTSGAYTIQAPANATLVFSFMGMGTVEEAVNNRSTIDATLREVATDLNEVVVIGYGSVKKRDLTGAVSSVSGRDIASVPVTTAAQAISGKMAGVNVTTSSGAPGADVRILVRGGTSITQGTSPLYIVDGYQMDDGLRNVDINDIESINVMKDASSTAIYGARGANGVVLITTKNGSAGKTTVSYNGYASFEQLSRRIDLLGVEDYVKYQYDFQYYNTNGNITNWAEMYVDPTVDVTQADFNPYSYIHQTYGPGGIKSNGIDWQEEVFGGHVLTQSHNVSVSSGLAKGGSYLISYNYMGQDGLIAKTGYARNNLRAKLNQELFKGVRFDMGVNLSMNHLQGGGAFGNMKHAALQPPTGGFKFTLDQLLHNEMSSELDDGNDVYNPLILQNSVTTDKYTRQAVANAGLEFDIPGVKGLMFRTAGTYTWQQTRSDQWLDETNINAARAGGPYGSRNNSEKFTWQVSNTLNYQITLADKHSLTLMLGQETWYTESMNLNSTFNDFPIDNFGLNNVGMAGSTGGEGEIPITASSGKSKNAMVSVFGRVMYNYDERYLLTATLRGDGSSKFIKGKQWGYLPSFSAAWRISEEAFWEGVKPYVNNFKLRGGYGETGNCDIGNNLYSTDYSAGHYFIGSSDVATLNPASTMGNPNLMWEQTKSTSIGLDLGLFNSRVSLAVDWYNNVSDNLLLKRSITKVSGYGDQYQNIGSIQNRGWEFVLNTVNVNKGGFLWTSDFNISFNKSKVLNLSNEVDGEIKTSVDSRVEFITREGEPLGQFWGYQYDGVYTTDDFEPVKDGSGKTRGYKLKKGTPRAKGMTAAALAQLKPGDIKFKCINGDTDADGNPTWSDNDRTVLGNAQPKFYGGFNNAFSFKGIDLSVFMNFCYGNKIFNMNLQRYTGPYARNNQNATSNVAGRYTLIDPATGKETKDLVLLAELNPNQHDPKQLWSIRQYNMQNATVEKTDYALEDGSYLRLSTITLGYTIPKRITEKAKISNLRVYVTANNIHTFTSYSGFDPDVSTESNNLTRGIDNSAYPKTSSWVVGLNLTF